MTSETIEIVRGTLDDAPAAQELLAFWSDHGGPTGIEAHRRLDEVVCVLRRQGEIAGVSSVFPADLELIGGRRLWIYRSLLLDGLGEHTPELIRTTFEALDSEPHDGPGWPIGLCVLAGAEERQRRPQAEWPDPRMVYAGYLGDGRQVRIAYFSDEVSGSESEDDPRYALDPGYGIAVFADLEVVSREDVISLWTAAAGLPLEEAERRIDELLLIATDPSGRLVGISTAYLKHNDQLRASFWHFRAFVAPTHRQLNIAVQLVFEGRKHLVGRHINGDDRRGIGVIMEIENKGLQRHFPKGYWAPSDYHLVGVNARGDHVRVHYFPDVLAPEPNEG